VTVFGYLILISTDFLRFYFFIFSLVLVSIGKIYQTVKAVFELHFQTPLSTSKILRYASYFQLSPRCLEMWSNTVFRFDILLQNLRRHDQTGEFLIYFGFVHFWVNGKINLAGTRTFRNHCNSGTICCSINLI